MLALAKDLVVSRAMFEDTTGAMTVNCVKGVAFKPAGEVVFEGYTRTVWTWGFSK